MFNTQRHYADHRVYPDKLLWTGWALKDLLNKAEYRAPRGHFNEKGHLKISEMLIQEIDRVILAK